jgi:hypothetical protein
MCYKNFHENWGWVGLGGKLKTKASGLKRKAERSRRRKPLEAEAWESGRAQRRARRDVPYRFTVTERRLLRFESLPFLEP